MRSYQLMKKCNFKGIETYIELIILDEKGREKSQYFLKCRDPNALYCDLQRHYLSLIQGQITHLSGTVIKVNLQITIALIVPVT